MEKLRNIALALVGTAILVLSYAATYQSLSLLNGSSLTLYNGTGDTAVTWTLHGQSYATNRTYVNFLGTTITPLATNSTTGEIYGEAAQAVQTWVRNDGAAPAPIFALTYTTDGTFTNTFDIYLARSVDGTYYDTSSNYVVFRYPATTIGETLTISTNLTTTFVDNAKVIKIWKVVGGANPADGGIITLTKASIGGWVQ